jgi:hypothetical protein
MAPVLKTHVLLVGALVNTWKLRKYLGISGAKTENCSKTVVIRRGGRAVEGASLENWSTGNRTGGSNPSLSARSRLSSIHQRELQSIGLGIT